MTGIPDKLINFRAYDSGDEIIGVADITLPVLSFMTEEIQGAGIAGPIDSPTIGHFQSLTVTINWRSLIQENVSFIAPKTHHLEFRGSVQIYDHGTGEYKTQKIKVVLRVMPKSLTPGNLTVSSGMGTSGEFEVLYLKIVANGTEMLEVDKLAFICRIMDSSGNMVDYLEKVREDLGM